MTSLTFLGTGNYEAQVRYWNSFVLDGTTLVEPSPTSLPHLRRCGLRAGDLDVVVISHFHADHTFGWPFLLQRVMREGRDRPFFVVGPPGVEQLLADMFSLGGVPDVLATARESLDVRYIDVDGSWQDVGPLRLRAVEVDHVPHLRCFGYLFDRGDRVLGYSGDTRPCVGLDELASMSDILVLECTGPHPHGVPVTHMDIDAVRALRDAFPAGEFVLTHVGEDVGRGAFEDVPRITMPDDFETIEL